ncbi:MAG: uroporphyrinogen decarboxylase family protein, partial [Rickettsiaceae bacterium]|nr:uroporphyrinogen decarboxylase family protein [Rickettsiaceae bacterium]
LDPNKTLIGFAGSPWTVATYVLSEKRQDYDYLRLLCYNKKELLDGLIEILINQTIIYLISQIESGVDVIKLFDSWAGILPEEEYKNYVIEPNKRIVKEIKKLYPDIPIICFPRGSNFLLDKFMHEVCPSAIAIDYLLSLEYAKKMQKNTVIQGNLDPMVLLSSKDLIASKIDLIMNMLAGERFIFNLGHGIDKNTPLENVAFMVDYVKNWKRKK